MGKAQVSDESGAQGRFGYVAGSAAKPPISRAFVPIAVWRRNEAISKRKIGAVSTTNFTTKNRFVNLQTEQNKGFVLSPE